MNARRRTPGWVTSASPASSPYPVMTLTTPGGNTCAESSPSASADVEVCSEGLITTVLPAISGATDLPAANIIGWLNGMIRPTTPNGAISV